MGLDMYMYSTDKHLDSLEVESREKKEGEEEQEREIGYWRKHNRLHGWFEQKWCNRHNDVDTDFNCVRYYVSREDLLQLEKDVRDEKLPATQGFFFGDDSYSYEEYQEQKKEDLEIIDKAKKELEAGRYVYYSSWW